MKLTPKERKILFHAQFRAAEPLHEIARKAGVREHTVRHCLESLLLRKIIEPITLFNLGALGFGEYAIYFAFAPISLKQQNAVLQSMVASEQVNWVGGVGSEFQYLVVLNARNADDVWDFFSALAAKHGEIFGNKAFSIRRCWTFYSRKHLLQIDGAAQSIRFEKPSVLARIDAVDHRILQELSSNPGRSRKSSAERLQLPVSTFQYRVDRLVEQNIIAGFIYRLLLTDVGTIIYRFLVEVKGNTPALREDIAGFCERHPNVVGMAECLGSWDYEIRAELYRPAEVLTFTQELYAIMGKFLVSVKIMNSIDHLKWSMYPFKTFSAVSHDAL